MLVINCEHELRFSFNCSSSWSTLPRASPRHGDSLFRELILFIPFFVSKPHPKRTPLRTRPGASLSDDADRAGCIPLPSSLEDVLPRSPEFGRYFNDLLVAGGVLARLFEGTHGLVVERDARHAKCCVSHEVLTRRLTSESGEGKNRAVMITPIRKQLDTCVATGCYSPSWSHSLLGEFQPRVNAIEF
jgi:hypothetical protein